MNLEFLMTFYYIESRYLITYIDLFTWFALRVFISVYGLRYLVEIEKLFYFFLKPKFPGLISK